MKLKWLDVYLSVDDKKRLKPHMMNWMRAHAYMVTLGQDERSLAELKKMIAYEITNRGRLDVVGRLYGRMATLRSRLEQAELLNAVP